MSQNFSPAVMQQRSEPAGSADYFGTPPWATRALMERLALSRSAVVWGKKKSAFAQRRPSTATSYEWIVWDKTSLSTGTVSEWLATRRSDLTKAGDYIA